jgi:ABC-type dipeptide/oligopeptide/nickel transport system permease component
LTLGISAAVYQNRPVDYLCSSAMLAVALPNFVVAVFFILLFSFFYSWCRPVDGMPEPLAPANLTLALGPWRDCTLHAPP